MLTLVIDTETTGMVNFNLPFEHMTQPSIVQLGAILYENERVVGEINALVKPELLDGQLVPIPPGASAIHGITDDMVARLGLPTGQVLQYVADLAHKADRVIAHNAQFDRGMLSIAFARGLAGAIDRRRLIERPPWCCTMLTATPVLKIPGNRGDYRWPKLDVAYRTLVDERGFDGAHDAMADVRACAAVMRALETKGHALTQI